MEDWQNQVQTESLLMLEQIEIRNFRSCHYTKVMFDRTICALSGLNGVGKSNILKAIEWICVSAVSPGPIKIEPAGKPSDAHDELNIYAVMIIDDWKYLYEMRIPDRSSQFSSKQPTPDFSLFESLQARGAGGITIDLIRRQGEEIQIAARSTPIRCAASTPAIAALLSLLPSEDRIYHHLIRINQFFTGIHYYLRDDGFEEDSDQDAHISESQYNDWLHKHRNDGKPTQSIPLRMIYMWKQDQSLFEELLSIIGPNGLDLVESIRIDSLYQKLRTWHPDSKENPLRNHLEDVFSPIFIPSAAMGGAGKEFSFSELSIGTRRVIHIVISVLFDKRSVMLLEQPENSIHPGLLRKLIGLLRTYSDTTQVLFTTHSPEVLDILDPEEVLLVTAPDGKTEARKLSMTEIAWAKAFLKNTGTLSEFLEPLTSQ